MSSDENKSPREPHSRFMRRSNSESGAVNLSATQPIGSNSSLRGSGRKKHSRKPSIHRSTKCYKCKSKFTLLKKKKLCRNCGREFCKACAIDKARLPHFGIDRRVRVCNSCFIAVTALSWDKMQADIAVEGTQGVKVSLSDDAFSTLSTRREVNPESLESIQQRLQAIPKLAQRSNSMSDVSRVVRQFDGEDKTKPMHFSKSDAKALRSSIQQAKAHSNKVKNLGLPPKDDENSISVSVNLSKSSDAMQETADELTLKHIQEMNIADDDASPHDSPLNTDSDSDSDSIQSDPETAAKTDSISMFKNVSKHDRLPLDKMRLKAHFLKLQKQLETTHE